MSWRWTCMSAFVRNDREILEGSIIAAKKQNARGAGESYRKPTTVTVGRTSRQNVGASVGGIEQGIECSLILAPKPRKRLVVNAASICQRGDGWRKSRHGSQHVPLMGELMIAALDILRANPL